MSEPSTYKLSPEAEAAIVTMLERVADGTVCVTCGADVRLFEQAGRSYYARPCGHRQGQGSASFFNVKIAAKRGLR